MITLITQYLLIRLLERDQSFVLHVALNKDQANLAIARYKVTQIERQLTV